MFRLIVLVMLGLFAYGCTEETTPVEENPVTYENPRNIRDKMMRGINIGNTLEAPYEGEWYPNPLREYYFDDIKEAGFTCVRIPVRWDNHTAKTAPYTIDSQWMERVVQVVNWGLERDLYIIINAHHEEWIKSGYDQPENIHRFNSIWRQISERFADKSQKLMFEIINEPKGLTLENLNQLNTSILSIIRETNPERIVLIGGNEWSNSEQLLAIDIPDDQFVMGYFHSYDPWQFAGEAVGEWGSYDDVQALESKFHNVQTYTINFDFPVMISEFGAVKDCDYNSRMLHYFNYVLNSVNSQIPFQVWDDGGDFQIYDRENRTWSDVKDILIYTDELSPAFLTTAYANGGNVYLSWVVDTRVGHTIIVERKINSGEFEEVADLGFRVTQYHETYDSSDTLYYRIKLQETQGPIHYSNPSRLIIP